MEEDDDVILLDESTQVQSVFLKWITQAPGVGTTLATRYLRECGNDPQRAIADLRRHKSGILDRTLSPSQVAAVKRLLEKNDALLTKMTNKNTRRILHLLVHVFDLSCQKAKDKITRHALVDQDIVETLTDHPFGLVFRGIVDCKNVDARFLQKWTPPPADHTLNTFFYPRWSGDENDPSRISAWLTTIMRRMKEQDKHTLFVWTAVLQHKDLPSSISRIEAELQVKRDTTHFHVRYSESDAGMPYLVQLRKDYEEEKRLVEILQTIHARRRQREVNNDDIQRFDSDQQNALSQASRGGVLILTGLAGSGKSEVVSHLARRRGTLVLTPTNIARANIKKRLVDERVVCATLAMWGINEKLRQSSVGDGISIHTVLVDEMSMVSTESLCRALETVVLTCELLVLAGDPGQLPSIAAGQVFRDLIDTHSSFVRAHLSHNHRSGRHHEVTAMMQRLYYHRVAPDPVPGVLDMESTPQRLHMYPSGNKARIMADLQKILAIRRDMLDTLPRVQIICDTNTACDVVNHAIQRETNPLCVGDKVRVHTYKKTWSWGTIVRFKGTGEVEILEDRKTYPLFSCESIKSMNGKDYKIFEGDRVFLCENHGHAPKRSLGTVESIFMVMENLKWVMTATVLLDDTSDTIDVPLSSLALGYAITIHSYQGNQAPGIICCMTMAYDPSFTNKEMLYTAMTRYEERLCVFHFSDHHRDALQFASSHPSPPRRTEFAHLLATVDGEQGVDDGK